MLKTALKVRPFRYIHVMSQRKKKTDYLSYIEDTKKHYPKLEKIASDATRRAIGAAKAQDLFITYQEGEQIVREHRDGTREVIGQVTKPILKVEVGSECTLSEK